jgi:hypothetical protein
LALEVQSLVKALMVLLQPSLLLQAFIAQLVFTMEVAEAGSQAQVIAIHQAQAVVVLEVSRFVAILAEVALAMVTQVVEAVTAPPIV